MIKIQPTPIKLELKHCDPWQEIINDAWVTSRPNVNPDEVDYEEVLGIDTPVSEMAGFVLSMTVPILFREIIVSMRDHIVWARTSRVDNLLEVWPIQDGAAADLQTYTRIGNLITECESMVRSGASQDTFRQNLPLSYMTSFTIRLSIRSAIKLLKFFDQLADTVGPIMLAADDFRNQLGHILCAEVLDMESDNFDNLLSKIKSEDLNPEMSFDQPRSGKIGDYLVASCMAPISFRAQVIRHRPITVIDDLRTLFMKEDVWSTPISYQIRMAVGTSIPIWKKIVGKRNCWLAQSDLWKPLIDEVNLALGGNDFIIPCDDAHCPYDGDCQQRLMKKDPGVPCPRHLLLAQRPTIDLLREHFNEDEYLAIALHYVHESKRPVRYWNQQINELTSKLVQIQPNRAASHGE